MNKWRNELCSLKVNIILLENAINFSDIIFSLQFFFFTIMPRKQECEEFNRIKVKIRSHFKNLAKHKEDEKILNELYYF